MAQRGNSSVRPERSEAESKGEAIGRAIRVEGEVCRDHARSSRLEWLETNGTGGYAMGTVAGTSTRRYHGLLVVPLRRAARATRPQPFSAGGSSLAAEPVGERHVLLARLEEGLLLDGEEIALATNQYPGTLYPEGYRHLSGFRLDPFPTWTFEVNGVALEKRLFLVHGRQALVVRYRASRRVSLRLRPFLAFRDYHALGRANGSLDASVREVSCAGVRTLAVRPYRGLPELRLHHSGGAFVADGAWHRDTEYLEELDRGLDFREDLWRMGTLSMEVEPGADGFVVATTEPWSALDRAAVDRVEEAERSRRSHPLSPTRRAPAALGSRRASPTFLSGAPPPTPPPALRGRGSALDVRPPPPAQQGEGWFRAALDRAADQFVVQRSDGTPTVIAGYPWFTDWGRDTMIALPGLLLARGRLDEAREVIRAFLAHARHGLIPNRFPDRGEVPEYNTVDATLWLFQAVHAYLGAGGDPGFAAEVYPRAREILRFHREGTENGIRVDAADGLLIAGDAGAQLTWMDAKVGDWVVTPRHGKPVEVNALWYNAHRLAAGWAATMGDGAAAGELEREAARIAKSFDQRFWDPATGRLFDAILPEGPDRRLRPNQIFAVSLPFPLLELERQQAVVRAVERSLLTPVGLRTLAPDEPDYRPHYGGAPRERDGAYHQGLVWPWLLGPFIRAYLNAFGRSDAARAYCRSLLRGLERHLAQEGCLGSISEILEPEPPYRPVGAPAQAWSVAEILDVLETELRETNATSSASTAIPPSMPRDLAAGRSSAATPPVEPSQPRERALVRDERDQGQDQPSTSAEEVLP